MDADLNRFWDRVASAVAEGEVGEVDVVAVHELGQTGSQKQKNLRVCEAQEQRHGNPLVEEISLKWHTCVTYDVSGNEKVGACTLV